MANHRALVFAKAGVLARHSVLACVVVVALACSDEVQPTNSASAPPQTTQASAPPTTPPPQPDQGRSKEACKQPPSEPLADPEQVAHASTVLEGNDAVAKVDAVIYPHPDYEGSPWSQWGQGLVLSDGRFLSAIGDHLGPDGNSYIYEYSPDERTLTLMTDVLGHTDYEEGTWGYGKIHGQMVMGACDEVYFSTYWGSSTGLSYGPPYTGDLLFRLHPEDRSIANLGVPASERGIPSLAGWSDRGFLYGEIVDPASDPERGGFFAYDIARGEVVFRNDDPSHSGFRNIAVDSRGRAYYSTGPESLAVYDPATNRVSEHSSPIPGGYLRASTPPTPDGVVYGVTAFPENFFALLPSGEIKTIGEAQGYTASIALDPDLQNLLYAPNAHGGGGAAPLISLDTDTGEESILVDLDELAQSSLGLRLAGSYNVAVDRQRRIVYVGMNAGELDAEDPYGEIVLFIVHLS
jgi:hypothetical protein